MKIGGERGRSRESGDGGGQGGRQGGRRGERQAGGKAGQGMFQHGRPTRWLDKKYRRMMQYYHRPQPVWLKILYQANENTEDIVSIKSISNVPIHSRHAPDAVWRRASKATAKRYEDATYDGKSVAGEKSATGCIGWYRYFL